MSAFSDITAALQALLLQAPPLAGGRVWRGRLQPLAQEHDTAVVLRILRAPSVSGLLGNPLLWESRIAVDCHARAAVGQDPEDAVDALLMAVYARLAAAGQFAPGVSDAFADPAIEWDVDEADTALATATLVLSVRHQTQSLTLAAAT